MHKKPSEEGGGFWGLSFMAMGAVSAVRRQRLS